jgi:hypothetical protein
MPLRGLLDLDETRRAAAYVDMRARRQTRQFASERDEGNAVPPQVSHQHAPLGTVRAHRNIHRFAMIKHQPIVGVRLTRGAYRHWAAEALAEESVNFL